MHVNSHEHCITRTLPRGVSSDESGGVALILVIWVMVILIAIVGEFSYSMRTEINITRNFKEEEEAYQLALAGIQYAKAEILSARETDIVYQNEDGVLIFGEGEEKDESENAFEPTRKNNLGKGNFAYTITDEDGKLNINTALAEQLRQVFLDSGVDILEVDAIVDSIIDWRDTNDLHMLNGAEDDYYQSLDHPYSCKDGPFDSLEELLLVKGMSPEIFYGSRREDDETIEEDEKVYEGVAKYLTVYGSRININTAPEVVLETVLGTDTATTIISQREAAPLTRAIRNGKTTSVFFTIVSTGMNSDGTIKRSVKITVQRKNRALETLFWNDNIIG